MCAAVCRASIEGSEDASEAEALRLRVLSWLRDLGLHEELEPREADLLSAPIGTLAPRQAIDGTWAVEGLVLLAWALRRHPLPAHDAQVDPYEVADSLDFLSEDAADLITGAALRSSEELEALREVLYAVHCRLRDWMRHRKPKDITSWIEPEWLGVLGMEADALLAGSDLKVGGQAVHEAGTERMHECECITRERHRAAIWLVGEYPVYGETPVDT